jgi:signal transduction histidine kinase
LTVSVNGTLGLPNFRPRGVAECCSKPSSRAEGRLEPTLVRTAASGGEVDQSLAEILSVAGHELTQPLTVALACARLMKEPPPAGFDENDKRHIQEILERNLVQMQSLLEDLEVLVHLETLGDTDYEPSTDWGAITMGPVLKKAADDFSASHPHWEIDLRCEGNLRVKGDVVRFRQVLSNLLGNAAKFGERGTPIQLEGHADGQDVVVTVHNEGVGFASEEAGNIFDKRARLAQKVEGRGWGLYVAKAIIEAHGGRLWAESEKSRGATFVISVPALST